MCPEFSRGQRGVRVPKNAGGMGLSEFYVMKYEAKGWEDLNLDQNIDSSEVDSDGGSINRSDNIPVSIPDNKPWKDLNATKSGQECESIGANYHLISNAEWIAISRDIENIGKNWTGGRVGSGCLFSGNHDTTTVGTGENLGDSCGYSTGSTEDGIDRDIRARHILSNGQVVFDLAGNIGEWVDWDMDTPGFQLGPETCTGCEELSSVTCIELIDVDYNTRNGGYTSTQGTGLVCGGSGGAGLRGGAYGHANAGLFAISFTGSEHTTGSSRGYRCVYRP